MKKLVFSFLFIAFATLAIQAQTNVSGGIYTNTTWTLANSPYIVTSNVVVFPGVTLTLEPGVIIKFGDNTLLEIRQASLIANGTASDSITFTSNNATPGMGIWYYVYLNSANSITFNFCNFKFATQGILDDSNDTLIVKNSSFSRCQYGIAPSGGITIVDSCNFSNNQTGIINMENSSVINCNFSNSQGSAIDGIESSIIAKCTFDHNQTGVNFIHNGPIDSCIFNKNQYGIITWSAGCSIKNNIVDSNSIAGITLNGNDTLTNCQINSNGIGISATNNNLICKNIIDNNIIGIKSNDDNELIYCNRICNNTFTDFLYYYNTNNLDISNNYWCTTDSLSTSAVIYDGYDSSAYGLVHFMPIDTLQCYSYSACSVTINIYPDTLPNHYFVAYMSTGVLPLRFLWNWGDGTFDTIPFPSHIYNTVGTYNICLTITDSTGCISSYCSTSTNLTIYVNVVPVGTAINEIDSENFTFNLFPNPATNNLTIETPLQSVIEISNIQGQIIKTLTASGTKSNIDHVGWSSYVVDVSTFPSGVFIVEVKTEKGVAVKKFVKE